MHETVPSLPERRRGRRRNIISDGSCSIYRREAVAITDIVIETELSSPLKMSRILNGIVAVCPDLGIGKNGHLPWHPVRLK